MESMITEADKIEQILFIIMDQKYSLNMGLKNCRKSVACSVIRSDTAPLYRDVHAT